MSCLHFSVTFPKETEIEYCDFKLAFLTEISVLYLARMVIPCEFSHAEKDLSAKRMSHQSNSSVRVL